MSTCYPNVEQGANKGVILEIRRERTIELVMEGLRQWDLFRWKEGKQMFNQYIPYYGIYIPGVGTYDMDGDGKPDLEIYETTATSQCDNKKKLEKEAVKVKAKYKKSTMVLQAITSDKFSFKKPEE